MKIHIWGNEAKKKNNKKQTREENMASIELIKKNSLFALRYFPVVASFGIEHGSGLAIATFSYWKTKRSLKIWLDSVQKRECSTERNVRGEKSF